MKDGSIRTIADLWSAITDLPDDMNVVGFCGGNGYHTPSFLDKRNCFAFTSVGTWNPKKIVTIQHLKNVLNLYHLDAPVYGTLGDGGYHAALIRVQDVMFVDGKPVDDPWNYKDRKSERRKVFVLE